MNSFYCPQLASCDDKICLEGDEARHVAGVHRMKLKDRVTLFDGTGAVACGEICAIAARSVLINIDEREQQVPPSPRLLLASALPKGDRLSTLLDMTTQLGMTDFIPLDCERSVTRAREGKTGRMKRICISACKQSRQYFVPEIHLSHTPEQLLNANNFKDAQFVLADPSGEPVSRHEKTVTASSSLVLIIGPEGGFSKTELSLFERAAVKAVKINKTILRIEAAGVVLLSQINLLLNKTE